MRIKKPTQNKLAVSQLELVKEVTQFMHQRLGRKMLVLFKNQQ